VTKAYDFLPKEQLERYADGEVRHKSGCVATDFLLHFLKVFRPLGYATRDNSWGELEKKIAIFFPQAILSGRIARTIFRIDDMRDISPKMINCVADIISEHYLRCPACAETDHPGTQNYDPADLCLTCDGKLFVRKN
jgi:hypothetical protein